MKNNTLLSELNGQNKQPLSEPGFSGFKDLQDCKHNGTVQSRIPNPYSLTKIFAALLLLIATATAQTPWDGTANTDWYTSNPSATTFTITTAEQLAGLAQLVNGGNTFESKTVRLGADIVLNENAEDWESWETTPPANTWMAIGNYTYTSRFNGTFDGDGHVVKGVYINNRSDFQGLFGVLDEDGIIKNLGVVASCIKGGYGTGGLVGYNESGTVSNSYSTGTVIGSSAYIGGLVGYNIGGTISNSNSTSKVTGNNQGVGGLVGYSQRGVISNSYSTGTVIGNDRVGGLVGIIGWDTVNNSYSIGVVTGNNNVGGLVGENWIGTVNNSYSTGTVTGNQNIGGLVGYNYYDGIVSNSYSTGTVIGNQYVGGLVGYNYNGGTVSNSYYDSQTSGQTDIGKGEGKTTEEMQSLEFTNILNVEATALSMNAWNYTNGKYPVLSDMSATINIASCFTSGNGTKASPYIITTKGQLKIFSLLVNSIKDFNGEYFKLGNDIALNDTANWQNWGITPPASSWTAIGTGTHNGITSNPINIIKPFRGTFDGNGHVVSGVYINSNTDQFQGLFGYLDENGIIKNLSVVNSYIKGSRHVGGLVGGNGGTVINSHFIGTVTGGYGYMGGLVGYNNGTVSNSYSAGAVTGGYGYMGGLVGYNNGKVNNSYYDKTTNGRTDTGKGEGKTTAEMQAQKFVNLLSFGATLISANALVYSEGKYPILSNILANTIDGSGTETSPYIITTKEQLETFSHFVNSGNDFNGKHIQLYNDIALNDTENWQNWGTTPPDYSWTPIGIGGTYSRDTLFSGTFDGNGNIISGVYINTSNNGQGLFGYLGSGGTIKNIGIVNSYIKGGSSVGGLVGNNNGGSVINGHYTGAVAATGSYARVGGLVGDNEGIISNSYSSGTVAGNYGLIGGLAGTNVGSITNSYSTGVVTEIGTSFYVGGLVGSNQGGSISNSYFAGTVTGYGYVGGLVGENTGNVRNSYSIGMVTVKGYGGGGLVGSGNGTVINSYYDIETSGQTDIGKGEGKTTAEMQTQEFVEVLNFADILSMNVWGYSQGEYPVLLASNIINFASYFTSGDGTEANPYIIRTKQELEYLYFFVDFGKDFSGIYFKLGNNIALNNTANWQDWATSPPVSSWTAIGTNRRPFRGVFDGAGYVVSGVYINNTSYYQGLFGYLGSGGTIKNLGVVDSYIKGNGEVGGLVGNNRGTVSNSYFEGTVTGNSSSVGGLVGSSNIGTIINSHFIGTVIGNNYVGGLVGYIHREGIDSKSSIVINSYSTGTVMGSGDNVGGLVGMNTGTVSNSYSTSMVTGNQYVGGLAGSNYNSSVVNNSYSTGTVMGSGDNVGGLIGYNDDYNGIIINSYYDKETSGQTDAGKGEGKTTTEMRSQEFVNLLNAGATVLSMNAWGYTVGKYPELTNTLASSNIATYFAGGYGTEETPYIITTKGQLEIFSLFVNSGNDFNGKYFKLGANIALNNTANWQNWATIPPDNFWTSIGVCVNCSYSNSSKRPFRGTFDGDSHVVSGVYINITNDYQGLFGYLGEGGVIKNLGVVDSYIKGNSYVGGLVGYNQQGTVNNSYSTGMVIGSSNYVGGLVGSSNGTVNNNYSTSTVTGNGNYVGGLVGLNNGTVNNNYSIGTVTGNGNYVGGLVGYNGDYNSIVSNSYYGIQTSGQTDTGKGIGKTTAEMQTREFTNLLNKWATIMSMNAWDYTAGKYPALTNMPAVAIAVYFAGGNGTEETPYIITTKEQLEIFSLFVNSGNDFDGEYFKLGANITLNNTANWQNWATTPPANSWTAIGTSSRSFRGTFDGNGHVISGIYINSTEWNIGLFGYLGEGGTIKNIGVIDSYINGGGTVGGLVGHNNKGTISSSYSMATVTGGGNYHGGLVAYNERGTIINSFSAGVLISNNIYSGGLVGYNERGTITNSYYDTQTSKRTGGTGTGKTTAEMKLIETYAGWDFRTIWDINSAINNGYPYLNIRIKTPIISDLDFTIPTGIIYTGEPQGIGNVTGAEGMGTITVLYNSNATIPTDAGTYAVTAHIAENSEFSEGIVSLGNFTITLKPITITGVTATDITYNGTTQITLNDGTLAGVENGDIVGFVLGNGTVTNSAVGNNKPVTTAITLTGSAVGNYTLTQPTNITVNITPKPVTITGISASNKQYNGNTTATITGTATVTGAISGDNVTVTNGTATFADINVGSSKAVTFSGFSLGGTSAGNYTLTAQPASTTANITVKPVTITGISAASKEYDGSTAAIMTGTPTIVGMIDGDDVSVVNGTASFANSSVGTNKLVTFNGFWLVGTDADNYILLSQPVSVTADITPVKQTPTIAHLDYDIPEAVYNSAPQGIGSVTGANGMGAITVKYSGETTTPTNAGTYTVTAHIAEGMYFSAGVVELGTFVIEKAHHNISHIILNDHEVTHNGEEHCHIGHTGELPAGVTVVFENDHHCQSAVGNYPVKLTFVNNDPNYHDFDETHYLEALLNIVAGTPTISAKPATGGIIAQTIGKDIVLTNLPQNAKVEVFGLNGKRVGALPATPINGALRITVQTKGVYIVKAGGQSLRVVVR